MVNLYNRQSLISNLQSPTMRFLIHEQPYEKPLAAGAYRYEREGQPTGAVESWRLTQATADFMVLRVDVDERAVNGRSTLYHYLQQKNGRPERLTYRLWDGATRIEGKLIFNDTSVIGTRTVNGTTVEEDIEVATGYGFWFPTAVGAGTAVLSHTKLQNHALTLNSATLALQPIAKLSVLPLPGLGETMMLGQKEITYYWTQIIWDQQQMMRLGQVQAGYPVWGAWMDGLTAVATRYFWYQAQG